MDAISIAARGMMAAADRFSASAERMVAGKGDIATETVQQMADKLVFEASAQAVKSGDDTLKRLLDLKV
jgi:hypothetical protein